jgi:hypothetical protein
MCFFFPTGGGGEDTDGEQRRANGEREVAYKGNYMGSSKGMETNAVKRFRDLLVEEEMIDLCVGIVQDNDSSAAKLIRSDITTALLEICIDPNHYGKNRCV